MIKSVGSTRPAYKHNCGMHYSSFGQPLEQQLTLSLAAKQQWVESVELAIKQKAKHDFGCYAKEQQFVVT